MARLQPSTDRQIAALKPADKVYEMSVGDSRGLGVRVFPTGLKQFEFRYVATNGTRRRLCLGAYPDLSL
ncbi:MAG: Arm DNA-binding domain-containing protein, partial [Alphaproteobacteria bacterium]|nr:Arm DNA-binding domain-containing protein [Alphaproteobacteria bacterium]